MGSSVWVITGFKVETFDTMPGNNVRPANITGMASLTTNTVGKVSGPTETIMHGVTCVENEIRLAYAFIKASLQTMEDFENVPLGERGLGAVSGGFISSTKGFLVEETAVIEQEWGVVDTSNARCLCGFYSDDGIKFNRVMACFHRTKAAPVSGFWRNGKALIGPEVPCDTTDWAVNIKSSPDSGSYAISLEKVTSTVVVGAEFPELLADGAEATVKAEHMYSQVFTNGSTATMEDHFNMKTSLLDTHTFVFQEGTGIDWSAGWKAKVPRLSEENTTVEVEVVFGAHQLCATTKPQIIDRSAKITLAPMTGCKAMARYVKSVLTVDAILSVQTTYTNGAVATRKVPATYTSVSYDNAEIKLEGIAVVAKVTAGDSRLGRLRLAAASLSSAAQSQLLEWLRYVRGLGAGRFHNMHRQHQLAANGSGVA